MSLHIYYLLILTYTRNIGKHIIDSQAIQIMMKPTKNTLRSQSGLRRSKKHNSCSKQGGNFCKSYHEKSSHSIGYIMKVERASLSNSKQQFFTLKKVQISPMKKIKNVSSNVLGDFRLSLLENPGLLKLKDGSRYKGDIKSRMFDGYGCYQSKEQLYFGQWKQGLKEGKGKFLDKKTNKLYVGQFQRGMKNGKGIQQEKNGVVYDGNFLDDKRQGFGILSQNGEKYEGQWLRNKFHGEGKVLFKDGSSFKGQWLNGVLHGKSVLTEGSTVCNQEWECGVLKSIAYERK